MVRQKTQVRVVFSAVYVAQILNAVASLALAFVAKHLIMAYSPAASVSSFDDASAFSGLIFWLVLLAVWCVLQLVTIFAFMLLKGLQMGQQFQR